MICRRQVDGWEIIYQRNHALLAAELLAPWPARRRPQPWFALLNACSQHDHGWLEIEADSLLDEYGQPVDFLHMPTDSSIALSRRNLRGAEAQSRWCAVLVARHLEHIFAFKNEPATEAFVTEIRKIRQAWMAESGLRETNVEELYELLCWADTLSLLLVCQPSEFTESLALRAQGQTFTLRALHPGAWQLNPWPYRQEKLSFDYEFRHLAEPRFADDEIFRLALSGAKVQTREIELRR